MISEAARGRVLLAKLPISSSGNRQGTSAGLATHELRHDRAQRSEKDVCGERRGEKVPHSHHCRGTPVLIKATG